MEKEITDKFVTDPETRTKYKICKLLGEGSFGRCFLAEKTSSRRKYAAKIVSKKQTLQNESQTLPREIEIHYNLCHSSIVHFYEYFEDELNWYLILEYCCQGTLREMLTKRKVITVSEVRYIMLQLVNGCKYIHDKHYIHRDLKLENILLNDKMKIKIGDFGLSTYVENGQKKRSICGTLSYMAPEILLQKGYNHKVDIWALGCIMYALLIGSLPFKDSKKQIIKEKIIAGKYWLPSKIQDPARKMIENLLQPNPLLRPCCAEVLLDCFF